MFWMLFFNIVLVVGKNIIYVKVCVYNCYIGQLSMVIIVKDCLSNYFIEVNFDLKFEEVKVGNKFIFYFEIFGEVKGSELEGVEYEQLMLYVQFDKFVFKVLLGDFVFIEDGIGIVYIVFIFGVDDF